MSKKNIVLLIVVVLVVVGAFWVKKTKGDNAYSVVYMTTGEVYIGKLSTFPDFSLSDSYQFQVVKDATDPNKSSFQLQPTSEALWAPKSMHIIKDNVAFYGSLMSDSKIAETLAAKK